MLTINILNHYRGQRESHLLTSQRANYHRYCSVHHTYHDFHRWMWALQEGGSLSGGRDPQTFWVTFKNLLRTLPLEQPV